MGVIIRQILMWCPGGAGAVVPQSLWRLRACLKLGHGHDERLPIRFVEAGLPALWRVVQEFCG